MNLSKTDHIMSVKKSVLVSLLSVCFLWTALSQSEAPVSWSGKVIDLRTGSPISGAKVYGGGSGRVDLTEAAITDTEGCFTVTYEGGALDLDFWKYYLLTVEAPDNGLLYFHHESIHTGPVNVTAKLLPKHGYFQGVVSDASNDEVIPGATISLGAEGNYIETLITGSKGEFGFTAEVYNKSVGTNFEIGIDPINQAPHDADKQPVPITNYWLEASAEGYQRLETSQLGMTLHLISSVTDEIHTFVKLELSPTGSSTPPNVSLETIDPTLYQQCIAAYFTEDQLADPETSGQKADPDADGLTNIEECTIGTHPLQSDSDDDGMPDGWEFTNGTAPLEADAHLDLDGDAFSNRLEFLYQSDARDILSIPDIGLNIQRAVRVDVTTIEGVSYQIQSSQSPDGTWTNRGTAFEGNNAEQSFYFDAETDVEIFKAVITDNNP